MDVTGAATGEMTVEQINAAAPRSVYMSDDMQKGVLIFLGFVLLGVACLSSTSYTAVKEKHESEALARKGREAVATVTQVRYGRGTASVYYEFQLGGVAHQSEANKPEGQHIHVEVGDQLAILYVPSDPSITHPIGWAWWTWWNLIPLAFMLFFSGIGAAGLVYSYRRRSLARSGQVTNGKVIACAPNPKGTRFRVRYQFTSEDGRQFDGVNDYSDDEYQEGAKVRVVYMRQNPRRNAMYPLTDFPTVDY